MCLLIIWIHRDCNACTKCCYSTDCCSTKFGVRTNRFGSACTGIADIKDPCGAVIPDCPLALWKCLNDHAQMIDRSICVRMIHVDFKRCKLMPYRLRLAVIKDEYPFTKLLNDGRQVFLRLDIKIGVEVLTVTHRRENRECLHPAVYGRGRVISGPGVSSHRLTQLNFAGRVGRVQYARP
jgi:hypothetical protein